MGRQNGVSRRAHAEAFISLCHAHGIEPLDVLADALRAVFPAQLRRRELDSFLLTPEAKKALRRALLGKDIPPTDVAGFLTTSWPFQYDQLFNPRARTLDVGTFTDLKIKVTGNRGMVRQWSRDEAIATIAQALRGLPEAQRVQHFPFVDIYGRDHSYFSFREQFPQKPPLPKDGVIRNMGFTVQELNAEIAAVLGIEYEKITPEVIVAKAVQWLRDHDAKPENCFGSDLQRMIDDETIDSNWIKRQGGVFLTREDCVQAIRSYDGVERLRLQMREVYSREFILERLAIHCPRIKNGKWQAPPGHKELRQLSIDNILPSTSKYLGDSMAFSGIDDLTSALGYQSILIPKRVGRDRMTDDLRQEARAAIDTAIRTLANMQTLLEMDPKTILTRRGLLEAGRLGFIESPGNIVGYGHWFVTESSLQKEYLPLFASRAIDPDLLFPCDRAVYDKVKRCVTTSSHGSVMTVSECHINQWAEEGVCPSVDQINQSFGSWKNLRVALVIAEGQGSVLPTFGEDGIFDLAIGV